MDSQLRQILIRKPQQRQLDVQQTVLEVVQTCLYPKSRGLSVQGLDVFGEQVQSVLESAGERLFGAAHPSRLVCHYEVVRPEGCTGLRYLSRVTSNHGSPVDEGVDGIFFPIDWCYLRSCLVLGRMGRRNSVAPRMRTDLVV